MGVGRGSGRGGGTGGGCLLDLRLCEADLRGKETSQRVCCKSCRATDRPTSGFISFVQPQITMENVSGCLKLIRPCGLYNIYLVHVSSAGDTYDVSKSLLSLFKVTLKCPKITTKTNCGSSMRAGSFDHTINQLIKMSVLAYY